MTSVITLTTDFGLQDGYVGMMKGVILGIHPDVRVVDVTHDIPPQDIDGAAFTVHNAYRFFPPGTIHVVVVDPGVGGARRAIIVDTGRYRFVGPDNGVFAFIYRMAPEARVTAITNPDYMLPVRSRTFHGRDVFAPVAAHLSRGLAPSSCGPRIEDYVPGTVPEPVVLPDRIDGRVVHVDRFGNLITDIPEDRLIEMARGRALHIRLAGRRFDRLSESYAEAPEGHPLVLVGSAGLLEVAVNGGHAARMLGVSRGDTVSVEAVVP